MRNSISLSTALLFCSIQPAQARKAPPNRGVVRAGTPDAENIVKARAQAKGQSPLFDWVPFSKEAFERAKKEGRYLLLDGAAEWCHWCHVMDETTYADPRVGALLSSKFIAIRVDIDERPDIGERYKEYGWPATILFSPDGEELGKLRGYLEADRLLEVLNEVASGKRKGIAQAAPDAGDLPATAASLPWVGAAAVHALDGLYDDEEGGWGRKQKLAVGTAIEVELRKARHGDGAAAKRVEFTLNKERAILDPVWGGVYQYSAARDWNSPHFEKLMAYQTANIEADARAAALPGGKAFLDDARHIADYIDHHLSAENGAFHPNQDADVNAHDKAAPFIDGHIFYSKSDAERKRLGTPRVDPHVYPRETGMAVAALATLYEVTKEPRWLARAKKAAEAIQSSFVLADGTLLHEVDSKEGPFLLGDAAWYGYALARLAEVSNEVAYRDRALAICKALRKNFDGENGGLRGGTVDPHAQGVFAQPPLTFSDAVAAARAFAALARTGGNTPGDVSLRQRATEVLAAIATPRNIESQGRFIGDFVLALDEVGLAAWPPAIATPNRQVGKAEKMAQPPAK